MISSYKKILIFSVSITLFVLANMLLNTGGTSPKAEAATSNGWNIPQTVKDDLNYFCSLSATPMVSQSTWISAQGDPLRTEVSVANAGDSVALQYNVIVYRCVYGRTTGIHASVFRTKGGFYDIPGLPRQPIWGIENIDRTVVSPTLTGDAYSFESVPFTVSSNGVIPPGADVVIGVTSRQFNWFTTNNILGCIVGSLPQRTLNPATETVDNCPDVTPTVLYRINIPRRFNYDLIPDLSPSDDVVNFVVNNIGDGASRQAGGAGARIDTRIWRTRGGVTQSVYYSVTDEPNGAAYDKLIEPGTSWSRSTPIPGGVNPGDVICAEIGVHPGAGITDGAVTDNNWRTAGGLNVNCITITAKPSLRIYGGDVVVGRRFKTGTDTCPAKKTDARIDTYSLNKGGAWVGSGTQFAASATGAISGFLSASMHNGAGGGAEVPKPIKGLSFGNVNDPAGSDTNGYIGCMPDYDTYVKSQNGTYDPPVNINQVSVDGNTNAKRFFMQGNVTITSDLISSGGPWSSLDKIEPIIVIVKGNITIDPSVKQIDGLYVAIPEADGSGGVINTCGGSMSDCRTNKLTVYGAFVANKVSFNRLHGDMAKASGNEPSNSNEIAESFVFPPELYLALMYNDALPPVPSQVGKYDSIVGLPPVL